MFWDVMYHVPSTIFSLQKTIKMSASFNKNLVLSKTERKMQCAIAEFRLLIVILSTSPLNWLSVFFWPIYFKMLFCIKYCTYFTFEHYHNTINIGKLNGTLSKHLNFKHAVSSSLNLGWCNFVLCYYATRKYSNVNIFRCRLYEKNCVGRGRGKIIVYTQYVGNMS